MGGLQMKSLAVRNQCTSSLLRSSLLAVLFAVVLVPLARGDTIYTYTGSLFNVNGGSYK
jgi:hypothetical protein